MFAKPRSKRALGRCGLRASRWLVFPVIFSQMLNYGIIRPSIPIIELDFFNGSYATSSLVSGVADASGALISFILSPMIGAYSDVHGRRPALILTLFVNTLPVYTLCLHYHPFNISLWYFFLVQAIAKLSTFASVYAYLADITDKSERSVAYAQMSGMVFIAYTLGPTISKFVSIEMSFMIAGLLSTLNLVYAFLVMPESRWAMVDDSEECSEEIEPVRPQLSAFTTLEFAVSSPLYLLLFAMVCFEQLAVYGIGEIFLLYLMRVLAFNRELNIELGIVGGVLSIFVMFVAVPILTKRIGEKYIIVWSIVLYLIYCIAYLFVDEQWQVFGLILLSALSTASYPATSSLLSFYVPSQEMGLAQGALSGIRALSLGVGPLIFAIVFATFTRDGLEHPHPAAPFVLGAILTFASLVVALKLPDSQAVKEHDALHHSRRNSADSLSAAIIKYGSLDSEEKASASERTSLTIANSD